MKKIAFFNHKGGVGKTTLTINVVAALANREKTVLLVDADPQCNLTSFYLMESTLEGLLSRSDTGAGETVWSAVKPVVDGRGGIASVPVIDVGDGVHLLPGDVLLSEYEEVLPEAWTECFARRTRGYDITTALAQVALQAARSVKADAIFYDVGPNVGALNRAILLDCDYFVTPVAADLFSLRALTTVGRSVAKWIGDWRTVLSLASAADRRRILKGKPEYIGYVTSAFKVNAGRNASDPHADWERRIAPRVRDRIVKDIAAVDPNLVPRGGSNKIGGVKHFHSLAPTAQSLGIAIGDLRGHVNSGYYPQVQEAKDQFGDIADEIIRRTGI